MPPSPDVNLIRAAAQPNSVSGAASAPNLWATTVDNFLRVIGASFASAQRPPTAADTDAADGLLFPALTLWADTSNLAVYFLAANSGQAADWRRLGGLSDAQARALFSELIASSAGADVGEVNSAIAAALANYFVTSSTAEWTAVADTDLQIGFVGFGEAAAADQALPFYSAGPLNNRFVALSGGRLDANQAIALVGANGVFRRLLPSFFDSTGLAKASFPIPAATTFRLEESSVTKHISLAPQINTGASGGGAEIPAGLTASVAANSAAVRDFRALFDAIALDREFAADHTQITAQIAFVARGIAPTESDYAERSEILARNAEMDLYVHSNAEQLTVESTEDGVWRGVNIGGDLWKFELPAISAAGVEFFVSGRVVVSELIRFPADKFIVPAAAVGEDNLRVFFTPAERARLAAMANVQPTLWAKVERLLSKVVEVVGDVVNYSIRPQFASVGAASVPASPAAVAAGETALEKNLADGSVILTEAHSDLGSHAINYFSIDDAPLASGDSVRVFVFDLTVLTGFVGEGVVMRLLVIGGGDPVELVLISNIDSASLVLRAPALSADVELVAFTAAARHRFGLNFLPNGLSETLSIALDGVIYHTYLDILVSGSLDFDAATFGWDGLDTRRAIPDRTLADADVPQNISTRVPATTVTQAQRAIAFDFPDNPFATGAATGMPAGWFGWLKQMPAAPSRNWLPSAGFGTDPTDSVDAGVFKNILGHAVVGAAILPLHGDGSSQATARRGAYLILEGDMFASGALVSADGQITSKFGWEAILRANVRHTSADHRLEFEWNGGGNSGDSNPLFRDAFVDGGLTWIRADLAGLFRSYYFVDGYTTPIEIGIELNSITESELSWRTYYDTRDWSTRAPVYFHDFGYASAKADFADIALLSSVSPGGWITRGGERHLQLSTSAVGGDAPIVIGDKAAAHASLTSAGVSVINAAQKQTGGSLIEVVLYSNPTVQSFQSGNVNTVSFAALDEKFGLESFRDPRIVLLAAELAYGVGRSHPFDIWRPSHLSSGDRIYDSVGGLQTATVEYLTLTDGSLAGGHPGHRFRAIRAYFFSPAE